MSSPSFELRILTTPNAIEWQDEMREVIASSHSLSEANWKFFHAVSHDDEGLAYNDENALEWFGRTLSPAELSCFASHFAIAKRFVENNDSKYLMIFEDDILIDPSFDFEAVVRMMSFGDIDYLRLYGRCIVPAERLIYWTRFQLFRFPWSPGGTQAYIYTRKGAQKFVDHVLRYKEIIRPIDHEMDRYWETGNPIFALHPWPVLERNIVTTIHGKDQIQARVAATRLLAEKTVKKGALEQISKSIKRFKELATRKTFEHSMKKADKVVAGKVNKFLTSGKSNRFYRSN